MKRIFSFLLVFILLLTGCTPAVDKPTQTEPTTTIEPTTEPTVSPEIENPPEVGFGEFSNKMIAFLENTSGDNENIFTSPLSLKYALILATLGAEGETQTELLDVLGFDTVDECEDWAKSYEAVLVFTNSKDAYGNETALNIANSIWHNTNFDGTIKEEYKNVVTDILKASVDNVAGNELKTKINDWVNKQTNGLIKNLVNDTIADANTVLANALYLKSSWAIPFNENLTHEDDFKTANGELVKKEYMQVYDTFNYYKDDNSELVVIPLQNDISMVCVKGDTNNLFEKIYNCDGKYLNLNIPKIDMEKEYCKKEFVNFLQQNGVTFATDMEKADFSNMIDAQIYIDDIIQKTKIKTDENGLEAAAVTAVIMKDNAIPGIQQEPILVEFNESFKFYIYNFNADGTTPELLFYGRYAQ